MFTPPEMIMKALGVSARAGGVRTRPVEPDLANELPRHPNGKLYDRLLRDAYRDKASRIV